MAALLLLEAASLIDRPAVPDPMDGVVPTMEADEPGESAVDESDGGDDDTAMEAWSDSNSSGTGRLRAGLDKRRRSKLASKPYRRAKPRDARAHNSVEKRRRAELSANYIKLKAALPAQDRPRTSNIAILNSAVDYIKVLVQQEQDLLKAIARERKLQQEYTQMLDMSRALLQHKLASDDLVPSPLAAAPRANKRLDDDFQTAPCSPASDADQESMQGLMLLAELVNEPPSKAAFGDRLEMAAQLLGGCY